MQKEISVFAVVINFELSSIKKKVEENEEIEVFYCSLNFEVDTQLDFSQEEARVWRLCGEVYL